MYHFLTFSAISSALFLPIVVAATTVDEDIQIIIYDGTNRTNRKEVVSVGNCLNIDDREDGYRFKVPLIQSIDPLRSCLRLWKYDCCRGSSVNVTPDDTTILMDLSREVKSPGENSTWLPFSISRCTDEILPDAPTTISDIFIKPSDRNRLDAPVNVKGFESKNVALYFDFRPNDTQIDWLYNYLSLSWSYVKYAYGPTSFGKEEKLYVIFHLINSSETPQAPLPDSFSPASGLHTKGRCRDLIRFDVTPGQLENPSPLIFDSFGQIMSQLVESSFNGTLGSPSYIWTGPGGGSSSFADLFRHDLYKNIGMTSHAERIRRTASEKRSTSPEAGTQWFRNWFFSLYTKYGGANVTAEFLRLRHLYFPQTDQIRPAGVRRTFSRNMNLGEYVHFMSGAVRSSLLDKAKKVLCQRNKLVSEYNMARADFPEIFDMYI